MCVCWGVFFEFMCFSVFFFFFFSSRRRHTRCREVSWARRCVQETVSTQSTWGYQALVFRKFLEVYGDMEFPKPMSKEMTTVRKELSSPLGAELIELTNNANPLQ
eukprot:TRINITY_DN17318_c0_g1_i2.p2 TRINITY_DN17318_c0_g1~~TRINITY_DN17318_c0_g1_i2.p2  ORF type:complete len:105 (-),score=45.90 TRINITY_DN17318_c0_g1_i2:145-459(-)